MSNPVFAALRVASYGCRHIFGVLLAASCLVICLPAGADSPSVEGQRPLDAALHEIAERLRVPASGVSVPFSGDPGADFGQALRPGRSHEQRTTENAVPGLRAGFPGLRLALPGISLEARPDVPLSPLTGGSFLAEPTASAVQLPGGALGRVPAATAGSDTSENAVEWGALLRHSMFFLGVQHGFRLATEEGTREGLKGPFFRDWYRSLSSLHGWSDGDPFYVNYIGHPMQGGVTGFIWRQNDKKYRAIEFGNNADYWRSLMRSMAYSFVYSAQFEIGPVSEATIGAIQSRYPQQGFVDHVVTPTIGTLWVLGEDILDRYVIRRVEGRTENVFLRMMVRGWLNPTRSFANLMRFRVPWIRDSRSGIWKYRIEEERARREAERLAAKQSREVPPEASGDAWGRVAPFGFTFSSDYSRHPAGAVGLNCIGGGGTAVWNRGPVRSWVAEVSGCKIFTDDIEFSGDILTYRVGSRWTKRGGRWMPYGQVLVGGKRATVERIPEDRREIVRQLESLPSSERPPRSEFVDRQQSNGFAVSMGGGVDYGLSRAAMLRLVNFDYTRAWVSRDSFASYPHSIRFSMGIVLRVGTW